jgi:hypothetical protein
MPYSRFLSVIVLVWLTGNLALSAAEPAEDATFGLVAKIVQVVRQKETSTIRIDCRIRNTTHSPILMQDGPDTPMTVYLDEIADTDEDEVLSAFTTVNLNEITLRRYVLIDGASKAGKGESSGNYAIESCVIPEDLISELVADHIKGGKRSALTIEFSRKLILPGETAGEFDFRTAEIKASANLQRGELLIEKE